MKKLLSFILAGAAFVSISASTVEAHGLQWRNNVIIDGKAVVISKESEEIMKVVIENIGKGMVIKPVYRTKPEDATRSIYRVDINENGLLTAEMSVFVNGRRILDSQDPNAIIATVANHLDRNITVKYAPEGKYTNIQAYKALGITVKNPTPRQIIGVSDTATAVEAKDAFQTLMLEWLMSPRGVSGKVGEILIDAHLTIQAQFKEQTQNQFAAQ